MIKSPIKWAGGKSKLLKTLLPILTQNNADVFVEPFMGSCTVALNHNAKKYHLADANDDLVNLFSRLSNKKDVLEIEQLLGIYFSFGTLDYSAKRDEFNKTSRGTLKRAALFIYLNKHCFNGLCRYNKSGCYNVPVGKFKSPVLIPREQIHAVISRFGGDSSIFEVATFQETFKKANELYDSALIYCDPPYVPLTSDFNYTADGFGFDQQLQLKDLAKSSKHTTIISNHYTDITNELYKDADEVYTVDVQRTISCSGQERKKVQELIVVYKG